MAGRTMRFEMGDTLAITVHGSANPSDEEWDALLDLIRSRGDRRGLRVIVFSKGGGPDVRQRKRLVAIMQGDHPPTVLLTDSIVARGVATAMSWFRRDLTVLATSKRREAFQQLGLSDPLAQKADATIDRFLRELGEL
jgi:hypothetical protein